MNHGVLAPQEALSESSKRGYVGLNVNNSKTQTKQPQEQQPAAVDDNGGTQFIATFQQYQPTALPPNVVRACNEWHNKNKNSENLSCDIDTPKNAVIDLTETSNLEAPLASVVTKGSKDESAILLTGPSHTSSACESALLSSVPAPLVPNETAGCILPLLSGVKPDMSLPLSPLQLEGVLLSIQKHRRIHHSVKGSTSQSSCSGTVRAGFFLGDGAGIGKGRQISGILRDSLCRGRKRHIWLSVSRELIEDARRDLKDVGVECASDHVFDGTTFLGDSAAENKGFGRKSRGILFLTYNLLVTNKRIEQIIAWCAGTEHLSDKNSNIHNRLKLETSFDGCIIFDEAHKAKNLTDNTKTAQLVLQLQRRLPMARVVYCSATGVSDVDQLAYAERLGLWKFNTCSPTYDIPDAKDHIGGQFADFASFRRSLEQRGLGSLELLALELKTRGSLMARTLSWEGAEFQTAEVPLKDYHREIYDKSVKWWNECQECFQHAIKVTSVEQNTTHNVWGTFWAAHQRFFKELAICAKVPYLADDALKQIKQGHSVVFGLQGTGEAGMQSLLTKKDQSFPALVSTVSAGLISFVQQHFPVSPPRPKVPPEPDIPKTPLERDQYKRIMEHIESLKSRPSLPAIPELVNLRTALIHRIEALKLPPNPLDDLIERMGGVGVVAEMTGRSGRVIRTGKGEFRYTKRVVSTNNFTRGEDSYRINSMERKEFMNGTKLAAIISDAASTGVSLHAARGTKAGWRRRVHYTIELPWSADKAVQQLGRSHRSGQDSAPIYKLVVTNLGGERRFAAAVSKRLASLGALTKGDRRAATGADLSDFDLDSKYGKRALKRFYNALEENEVSGGHSCTAIGRLLSAESESAKVIVDSFLADAKRAKDPILHTFPHDDPKRRHAYVLSVAVASLDRIGLDRISRSKADVRVFLNRISGLMVGIQTLVFSLFMTTLGGVMKEAKSSGEFEGTAEDITATKIEIGHEIDLAVDPSSGASTKLTTLILDRGISFDSAHSLAIEEIKKMPLISEETDSSMQIESKRSKEETRDKQSDSEDKEEDEDVNEWIKKPRTREESTAEAGFYISKNKIRGRHLVLFAKRKFDRSTFTTEEEASAYDPLGLMQITRPNTGTSPTDKTTRELRQAYYLALSCETIRDSSHLNGSSTESEESKLMKRLAKKVKTLWKSAFNESDSFEHEKGLAPRRQKVVLVNGPVLHIFPALEKVVQFRSEKDRSLKILRAEVGSKRIVGVRFPSDSDALDKLQAEIDVINRLRAKSGKTFHDEELTPICTQSTKWATKERLSMLSYISKPAKITPALSQNPHILLDSNRKASISQHPQTLERKRSSGSIRPSSEKKLKSTSMLSYFAKKKE